MFRNFFNIAVRNLFRNKAFSAINILGLAIGIATCLLIMLYVIDELRYDRYNEKSGRTVRVVFKGTIGGEQLKEANVMPPTAAALLRDYPEVEEATRLSQAGSPMFTYGDKKFEERLAQVDSNFFRVFTIPFIQGDPDKALREPNTMVISKALAKKYFGSEDPMGRILTVKSWNQLYRVTGVFDRVPANSHFHFELFASLSSRADARSDSWMSSGYFTYLVLKKGADYKTLEAKLPQVVEKYIGPQMQQGMGMSLAQFRQKGNDIGFILQPLTSIHLHSNMNPATELEPGGNVQYVYIFGAIAVFMLLVACINFMNLSTAGASKRAREIGIRKVLGSRKRELIRQFLFESIFLTFLALVLALLLVYISLPLFNQLSGKNLPFPFTSSFSFVPYLILLGLFTGVLAGSYPAFFISAFQPVQVLKGSLSTGKRSLGLRSGLVVFQFFVSAFLIIGTLVVYRQLHYIQNKKLGYDKNQVLIVEQSWSLGKNENAFRQEVMHDPRVSMASCSNFLPAGPSDGNNFFVYTKNNAEQVKTLRYEVDENYIPTMGMEILSGRNFSNSFASDSLAAILNETAVQALGLGNHPLGQTVSRIVGQNKLTLHVIGVVRDFHFRSLHEPISPLIMVLQKYGGNIILKTKTRDIAGLLSSIQAKWTSFHPENPLVYSFLDERYMDTYRAEQKTGLLFGIFAGLTIFVASLGLFGLAMFTAEQRTREIGIRKVLGASVGNLAGLLSGDFVKLVLISNVVAWPLAWWLMNKWLEDFAYRTRISWWLFAVAGILSLGIAVITISFQAIKAARANPVKSLRTE